MEQEFKRKPRPSSRRDEGTSSGQSPYLPKSTGRTPSYGAKPRPNRSDDFLERSGDVLAESEAQNQRLREAVQRDITPDISGGEKQAAKKSGGRAEKAELIQGGNPKPSKAETNEANQLQDGDGDNSQDNDFDYNPEFEKEVRKSRWVRRRKQLTIASIVFGLMTGGGGGSVWIIKGPLELLQLGSVLDRFSGHTSKIIKTRVGGFSRNARAAKTGDIAETRVNYVGSKIFHYQEGRLAEIGITFDRRNLATDGLTKNLRGLEFEAGKHPEYSKLSSLDDVKAAISRDYNVPLSDVRQTNGLNGGKFYLQASETNIKGLRFWQKTAIGTLEDGKLLKFMSQRVFAQFFRLPSVFHPIELGKSGTSRKLENFQVRRAFEKNRQEERSGKVRESLGEKYKAAKDTVNTRLSPYRVAIESVLLIAAVACIARDIAAEIVEINFGSVNKPSQEKAVGQQAIGSQIRSGDDFSLDQLAANQESLTDKNGVKVWAGKGLNAAANGGPGEGIDILPEYRQAFSAETTAATIRNTIDGLGGAIACSGPGQLFQAAVSVFLIVIGPGGWTAKVATVTVGGAVSMAAIKFVQTLALDLFTTDPVSVFAGAQGGNLLAFGARAASATNAMKMGGTALKDTSKKVTLDDVQADEMREFQKKPFAARLFDLGDYRSLAASSLRSTSNVSPAKAVSSLASSLLRGGDLVGTFASAISPKISAQEESYDWGSPLYGTPDEILNDPTYDDPYNNASAVAAILNAGQTLGANTDGHVLQAATPAVTPEQVQAYKDRAMNCYGVEFFKDDQGWNVGAKNIVNPADEAYVNAHCDDTSDPNWIRFSLFVTDTSISTSTECYAGDQKACKQMFYGRDGAQQP